MIGEGKKGGESGMHCARRQGQRFGDSKKGREGKRIALRYTHLPLSCLSQVQTLTRFYIVALLQTVNSCGKKEQHYEDQIRTSVRKARMKSSGETCVEFAFQLLLLYPKTHRRTAVSLLQKKRKTRAALGAVEPLGRHQYLKHELHAIGPSIKLSKYSALTR